MESGKPFIINAEHLNLPNLNEGKEDFSVEYNKTNYWTSDGANDILLEISDKLSEIIELLKESKIDV